MIAIVGVVFAWRVYNRDGIEYDNKLSKRFGKLYELWKGKYFWDEAYDATVVKPLIGSANKVFAPFDQYVVDGLVNTVGKLTRVFGSLFKYFQTGLVQNYATAILLGVVIVLGMILLG